MSDTNSSRKRLKTRAAPPQVAAKALSTTTSKALPLLLLLDLHDDLLKSIVSFCDAFSLGFLEMSCKKFHSQTMTRDAWKHLDNQISAASKYMYEGTDDVGSKTRAARFAKAARLADQVQPVIASHRHVAAYYEEENDDSGSSQEYCTGCEHIPNQLDFACFSSHEDEVHYEFFLRVFHKSDQRIVWQGFMFRSIFWENYFQLWFQNSFDPIKDCPEFSDVLDTFDAVVIGGEEENDCRKAGEDFFNSVGLIVVAYNETTESATLVSASTELAARDDDTEDWENDYVFRGIPESTHSLAPVGDDGESIEDLHTDMRFSTLPTGVPGENRVYTHRNYIPQFIVSYSGDW